METTLWALLPPLIAIVASIITKEVNLSLLIGIGVGVGLYTGFEPFRMVMVFFDIMGDKVHGNMGVLIFIVLLGMIVHLMNLSGATYEYVKWAGRKLETKKRTLLVTMLMGIIIFVDDYFNCLTVGTVMRPIADKNKISREKLAYIIDSTAAPICIVAPISSWAAAVSSSLPDSFSIDGFQLFIKTIICNYYTWFTLALMLLTILFSVDFGKMKQYESAAENETYDYLTNKTPEWNEGTKGKVIDLLLPIIALIAFSIIAMLYTGGFFEGETLSDAFANCDAIIALAIGGVYTVVFLAVLYLPRRIVTMRQFLDGLVEGFRHMVPAALILTFAWTLGGICGEKYLNAGGFVAAVVEKYNIALNIMPAIFFIVAILLAFSTGTSWGTFAILLPIAILMFNNNLTSLAVMTTAAVLGGSVCGDHLSPISDTTILSSTGAGCNHINHVATQMPYGVIAAVIAFGSYVVAGIMENTIIGLLGGIVLLVIFISVMKRVKVKKNC